MTINLGGGYRSSRRLCHSHAIIKEEVGIIVKRKLTYGGHVLWESMVCRIDMLYEHKVKEGNYMVKDRNHDVHD